MAYQNLSRHVWTVDGQELGVIVINHEEPFHNVELYIKKSAITDPLRFLETLVSLNSKYLYENSVTYDKTSEVYHISTSLRIIMPDWFAFMNQFIEGALYIYDQRVFEGNRSRLQVGQTVQIKSYRLNILDVSAEFVSYGKAQTGIDGLKIYTYLFDLHDGGNPVTLYDYEFYS